MANKGFPSMTALLGLLAVAGYQNRDKIAEMIRNLGSDKRPVPNSPDADRHLNDVLGQVPPTQSTSTGWDFVTNGLRELVDQFRHQGQGEVADSWVSQGPNKDISSDQLRTAIGSDVLAELSQRTGLSQQELLKRLSQQLPAAVDRYTPEGRLPAQ
jgi:uncharacterized protein YidB (DUF937 family)